VRLAARASPTRPRRARAQPFARGPCTDVAADRSYIHRDVKPANFTIGSGALAARGSRCPRGSAAARGAPALTQLRPACPARIGADTRRVLMIDFGLARKFVDDLGNVASKARALRVCVC
jgi:serine/threonine protein kinase